LPALAGWLCAALLAAFVAQADDTSAAARTLRIAAWNLHDLYHEAGKPIPGRDVIRTEEDYAKLLGYARKLDADVVALQEVNSVQAVHRVFPAPQWRVFLSGRQARDRADCESEGRCDTDGIYTGFAVRAAIHAERVGDLESLSVQHPDADGYMRPTRRGVEIEVDHAGTRLRLLSVHLKSGCHQGALMPVRGRPPSDPDCLTLARQVEPLDEWIDAREAGAVPFVILGDFNRRFDIHGARDHLWAAIDDHQPEGADLWRFPYRRSSECWRSAPPAPYYRSPIDFIVLDSRARAWVVPDSFHWLVYDAADAARYRELSDHCPVYLDLNLQPPRENRS
jgi:endonuclease/exonuclease/phosphatase family metal-dependent hydrolase